MCCLVGLNLFLLCFTWTDFTGHLLYLINEFSGPLFAVDEKSKVKQLNSNLQKWKFVRKQKYDVLEMLIILLDDFSLYKPYFIFLPYGCCR